MDEYYLSREEWDSLVELGVGDRIDTQVLKKISTATKTAFTKKSVPRIHRLFPILSKLISRFLRYNSSEHPLPFHKATIFGAPKKMAAGPAPDLEEAFDVRYKISDPWAFLTQPFVQAEEVEEDDKDKNDDEANDDVTKDKLIKQSKTKKAKAPAKSKKGKESWWTSSVVFYLYYFNSQVICTLSRVWQ